ncbi:hypothetical protein [Neobacillus citreus]|uniref:Sucrose phosphatase-like domain-containing protein n=1 Tax=Neobacillus citreus TaxID=2833578 RepID=A0A942T4H4_9BACI|nr:hypothetical protein [Neobacillus citreus]MCH6269219.1 hypothetical protein [Neobacillus citreus]
MIFASDLDRTIIYSTRAVEELGGPNIIELKPVERRDGMWMAYMTEPSYQALTELSRSSLFVPVTTRTTEQFKRFVIFDESIHLPYAITTNGAVIMYQGKPLPEWDDHISKAIDEESTVPEELRSAIRREGIELNGRLKQVGNLFFYYILDCFPTIDEIAMLRALAAQLGWRISLQGRKLYCLPSAIRKGAALEFICHREQKKAIAGAGDSILDMDFLEICQHRLVPGHGELAKMSDAEGLTFTNQTGVQAGEEILQIFLKLLKG